jgi:hypothetical protein
VPGRPKPIPQIGLAPKPVVVASVVPQLARDNELGEEVC